MLYVNNYYDLCNIVHLLCKFDNPKGITVLYYGIIFFNVFINNKYSLFS